jgi:2-polyprenyl-6-hydroxyphenyl methylase/3-demethylubiquinone-9 3-methyltransferase
VIQACATLVKPGGHLFFSTINRNPKAYALAIVAAEYLLQMLPRGTHEYRKFIRPSELAGWCREHGLSVREQSGLVYNPLTRRYRLSASDVSVNYLVHCRREQA